MVGERIPVNELLSGVGQSVTRWTERLFPHASQRVELMQLNDFFGGINGNAPRCVKSPQPRLA
jgi:hypothetical protein